jgi:para-nitrobenzyl esterase
VRASERSLSPHTTLSSRGLFRRAALESGTTFQGEKGPAAVPEYSIERLRQQSTHVISSLGCNSVACARQLSVESLLGVAVPGWTPVVDGTVVPLDPLRALNAGEVALPLDLMVGDVQNEGTMFVNLSMTADDYHALVVQDFGPVNGQLILARYPVAAFAAPGYAAAMVENDYFFTCPSRHLLQRLGNIVTNMYQWSFVHQPSWIVCPGPFCPYVPLKVAHFTDTYFVFGNSPAALIPFTAAEEAMSLQMRRLWVAFAATGTHEPDWPPYDASNMQYATLNISLPFAVGRGWHKAACDFWDSITPQ